MVESRKWTVDLVYVGEIADEGAIFYENPFIPMAVAVDDEFIYVVDRGSIESSSGTRYARVRFGGGDGRYWSGHEEFSNRMTSVRKVGFFMWRTGVKNSSTQLVRSCLCGNSLISDDKYGTWREHGYNVSDGTYLYVSVGYYG